MKLNKLIDSLNPVYIKGEKDRDITNIYYDSRKVTDNSIFIAIKGFKVDGHDFIKEAINKGAKVIIIERDIEIKNADITLIKVKDSRKVLAKVSSKFYDNPSKKIDLIGITGTNGKTTTTYLIKSILENANKNIGLIGTIGNIIDGKITKSKNTTPESLDLQEAFYSMVKSKKDSCIMEVSSHSLELQRVEDCEFNIGVFTNLTPEHLDLHKTIDNYLEAKIKLFYKTKNCNVINIDDPYGERIINEIKELKTKLLTYGIDKDAMISAKDINIKADGVSFSLNTPKGSINITMNIPGKFSVYNGLAAAASCYALGIDLNTIKKGLENVKGVKGRFEVIPTNKDFNVIIDYAHTPDGYEKILETVNEFAEGRKIIIFGCGGDRDKTKRPVMGEIAAKNTDLCIVTTDNPRSEDPKEIMKDIVKGIEKVNGNYITVESREDAIKYAIENHKAKDVILLVGKGHETYQIIGENVYPFNEREIVLDILKSQ
ncbi:MAG: UDP-N-acetylmuramoyl-L-alanyl-D-glutamate--2,6-diaminopimelate ligase [Firmicutes bacterium]|nr:UDP-N-acetylmuramoyl-L-alanyl-D-glutamate--2,6-diaminopimelate ligase [Bacillota bacterium]